MTCAPAGVKKDAIMMAAAERVECSSEKEGVGAGGAAIWE